MNAKNGSGIKRVMILMDEKVYLETTIAAHRLHIPIYQHINNILAKAVGMTAPKIKHPSNKYPAKKEEKDAETPAAVVPVPTPVAEGSV